MEQFHTDRWEAKEEEEEKEEDEGVSLLLEYLSDLQDTLLHAEQRDLLRITQHLLHCAGQRLRMEQRSGSKGDGNQSSSSKSFQQLWAKWSDMMGRLYDDPRVARVMKSRVGQYLISHPYVALTAVLFSSMAAVPVGLFITFAFVTIVMSAAGFVVCEVALLLVAGLILLSVLCGLALVAIFLSFIPNAFHFVLVNILKYYSVKKQQCKVEEKNDGETSYGEEHMD